MYFLCRFMPLFSKIRFSYVLHLLFPDPLLIRILQTFAVFENKPADLHFGPVCLTMIRQDSCSLILFQEVLMKQVLSFLLCVLLLMAAACPVSSESALPGEIEVEEISPDVEPSEAEEDPHPARTAFIEDIIALGKQLYDEAGGKLKRAHYKGDIYVCKNFTVYLFRQTRSAYRMAEFPDTELVIPNNLPEKQCRPYAYGYCWEEIPASRGNPFEVAAQFLYDSKLSKEENEALALEFMRQVRRGDYFQMTANYAHGVGAHSAIMISDYDPVTDTVHWMDSNMAGRKINGIRYGKVQYDAVESIAWWVKAFCQKKRGATLYRLREDIIFSE